MREGVALSEKLFHVLPGFSIPCATDSPHTQFVFFRLFEHFLLLPARPLFVDCKNELIFTFLVAAHVIVVIVGISSPCAAGERN